MSFGEFMVTLPALPVPTLMPSTRKKEAVGSGVGLGVGCKVGASDGIAVGSAVGAAVVGLAVGWSKTSPPLTHMWSAYGAEKSWK